MRHYTEEEMIAYELNESEQADAVREHLGGCAECAAVDAEVRETLETFAEAAAPEAEFERSWERVRGQIWPARGFSFAETPEAEGSVWGSLWAGLRDVFAAKKLPELQLESKPVAVVDRMAVKRDWRGLMGAVALELVILLTAGAVMARRVMPALTHTVDLTQIEAPPPAPVQKDIAGGGGGQDGATAVTKGALPPPMPKVQQMIDQPKIPMPPAIDLDASLKMPAANMPNFGDPRSPAVGSSLGTGVGAGIGAGNGNGLGAGTGGNFGGALRHVGGGVLAPILLTHIDPEFSEEARKAKFSGNVLVYLVVDAQGHPQNVHVVKPLGMGLDEKAVEAVKQYRFKPAMENGKPVPVEVIVEVIFQILG